MDWVPRTALAPCIGFDAAGISGKAFSAYQPSDNTPAQHCLEQLPERIAVPEAPMPGFGEDGMVRHSVMNAKVAEPAICQVEVHLPNNPRRGHRYVEHRRVLNGILWRLKNGGAVA
jgi:hypothetical protein